MGPKTVVPVVGFPRVVVKRLLALAELARGEAAAVEGVDVYKVGKAKASKLKYCLTVSHLTSHISQCIQL